MNSVVLDKTQPETSEALKNCKVGVPEKFTFMVTPNYIDDVKLMGEITEIQVDYSETEEPAEPVKKKPMGNPAVNSIKEKGLPAPY